MSQTGWVPDSAPVTQSGWVPDTPPGFNTTATTGQRLVTPLEGESFSDTMARAAQAGRTVTPQERQQGTANAVRQVPAALTGAALAGPAVLGAGVAAPEMASAAAGGGVLGAAAGGAAGGAATEAVSKGLQGLAGQDVFNKQSARDIGKSALLGGALGGTAGAIGRGAENLFTTKLARGMVNESLGASARDVTYGNPAKALLDEGITTPITGDVEKYKDALRSGLPQPQALQAAGGRVAGVAQKVQELSPQVDSVLSNSAAKIPVADVIDKPLESASNEIINNPAMTQSEKDAAVSQLGALQQSLKEGLGETISPLEANQLKQALGQRINWGGNVAVTDEVKPAYRALYGTLKGAVNQAVPEVAPLNERLTNLYAAQTDLEKLMRAEEVGQGKGALGSAVTGIARRLEAVAGRGIPSIATSASNLASLPSHYALPVPLSSLMNGGQQ
jgi:hypothetical protein